MLFVFLIRVLMSGFGFCKLLILFFLFGTPLSPLFVRLHAFLQLLLSDFLLYGPLFGFFRLYARNVRRRFRFFLYHTQNWLKKSIDALFETLRQACFLLLIGGTSLVVHLLMSLIQIVEDLSYLLCCIRELCVAFE